MLTGSLLIAVGMLGAGPARAQARPGTDQAVLSGVRAASVLDCPGDSGPPLASAVGVAAVDVGGCPGYLVADSYGHVDAYGSAQYHGGLGVAGARIVGISATSDGGGYWLVGGDGAVYAFGDAGYFGGANTQHLNSPVLGMTVTQDGRGYWLVASDGGIFSFGDARFYGSMGARHLNSPVDGMAVAPGGAGYWLVASDGGVFAFTTDGFYGSMGGGRLNSPVIGMSGTPDGHGYTLVASDGGVFNFGDSQFYGSLGAHPPASPITDLSPTPADDGYYLVDGAGQVFPFGPGTRAPATLTMSVPALPPAQVASSYQVTLSASGGSAPYAWTASGVLPPGLVLGPAGTLSGTPTQAGTFSFAVTVSDSGPTVQSTSAAMTVQVAPAPAPAAQVAESSVAPLTVTTTAVPTAYLNDAYDATLSAAGGSGPYTWSVSSGSLPDGLLLSSAGVISGTTTTSGTYDFTVEVRDGAGRSARGSLSMIAAQSSSNWSGYGFGGGPFTAVQGTFTVPSLTGAATSGQYMAEWVGIDGLDNNDLIQAGVALQPDPSAPGGFDITPWWEILPSASTPIYGMTINAGDTVTVDITQVATSTWRIALTDRTSGQTFEKQKSYSGPAASAEWIVEAPTVGRTQTSMAPYSPAVTFSGLSVSQAVSAVDRIVLVDPYSGQPTSTPSALDSAGFNVAYGATAPAAP